MGKVKKYSKPAKVKKPKDGAAMDVDDEAESRRLRALSLGKLKQAFKVRDKEM